jgi:hypothetical protein
MSIDLKPILAFLGLLAVEIYLGSIVVERMAINARARTTTATVTNEPEYVVQKRVGRNSFLQDAGYQFMYRYEVDGRTYAASGFHPEKPVATLTIYYDSSAPSVSRAQPEQTNGIALFMVFVGIGLAYNAWRIDWRGLFGRG